MCTFIRPVLAAETILKALIALVSNGNVVKGMIDFGGVIYVLHIFCDEKSQTPSIRALAAELLAKLQNDKLSGPRCTRLITKFLPPIFADALRDNSSNAYDGRGCA